MKLKSNFKSKYRRRSRSERGSAVVTVLILTAILLILAASNVRTLGHVQKELRLIEQKQLKNWHTTNGAENN